MDISRKEIASVIVAEQNYQDAKDFDREKFRVYVQSKLKDTGIGINVDIVV